MKKNTLILFSIIAVLLVWILFTLFSNKKTSENRSFKKESNEQTFVSAWIVQQENQTENSVFIGAIESEKECKIAAETQGKIEKLHVDLGSKVKKGQELLKIEHSTLNIQLQAVEVQIEGIEADLKRAKILAKEEAIQQVQVEKNELALKSAKIQKANIEEQIQKAHIKAPFDGIISAKFTELGSFVNPSMPLLQLTDLQELKLSINVGEEELKHFKVGESYPYSIESISINGTDAKCVFISPKAGNGNQFNIQFRISNNKEQSIKAGMFVSIYKSKQKKKNSEEIFIPVSSIVPINNVQKIFIFKSGKAYSSEVKIDSYRGNKAKISSGLNINDTLITSGFSNLNEGKKVKIKL
ncbi:MAG: efflux RND transporter periplasmic adaptor subunit [Flavobacteriia bacterium]|nr:efflux RND transporter periplasmic adaptor subunit [Flavobacteriia bacterium]